MNSKISENTYNLSDKKFTIILGLPYGMFANVLNIIQQLRVCEIEGTIPIIYWHGGLYEHVNGFNDTKGNVWEYYFKPVSEYSINMFNFKKINYGSIKLQHSNSLNVKINRQVRDEKNRECQECFDYRKFPPDYGLYNPTKQCREYVNSLIKKYIKLNDVVQEKLEKFYIDNIQNKNVIGIHCRHGHGMRAAQGHKPLKKYLKITSQYIDANPDCRVFVCSESGDIVSKFREAFGKRVFSYSSLLCKGRVEFNIPQRKVNKLLRLNKPVAGPLPGEEAIIDCILLSRCNLMVHGISNLSSAAMYWNVNLNTRFICKYTDEYKKYLEIP